MRVGMTNTASSLDTPAIALHENTYLHPGGRGVAEVSLTLGRGSILALLGPNGAGKSTILSLVAGFRTPQQGRLTVLGESLSASLRRRVGMVFQESSLDPLMTVQETLWLHGRMYGMSSGSVLRQRLAGLLGLVGLADRSGDAVETLSGGFKRRLELARAMLPHPELLLLDEPSLGLDPNAKASLWTMLEQINAEGTALLVATNDVVEAERYCPRVAFLNCGRVVSDGSPAELKRNLRRDAVRVEWGSAPDGIAEMLMQWPGVGQVTWTPPILHATVDDASSFVPRLFALVEGAIRSIHIRESTLEDAYFQHVGVPLDASEAAAKPDPAEALP